MSDYRIILTIEIPDSTVRNIAKCVVDEMESRRSGESESAAPAPRRNPFSAVEIRDVSVADTRPQPTIDDIKQAMAAAAGRLVNSGGSPAVIRSEIFQRFGITSVEECPPGARAALLEAINELK